MNVLRSPSNVQGNMLGFNCPLSEQVISAIILDSTGGFVMPRRTQTVEERFWNKVHKTTGCWYWEGALVRGYGQFGLRKGARIYAHRFSYELLIGSIADGLFIDHLCRNRACVNPVHMELVTNKENALRGVGAPAINARKTHCKNGHALMGKNIYRNWRGGRECKICKYELCIAWRKKRHEVTL